MCNTEIITSWVEQCKNSECKIPDILWSYLLNHQLFPSDGSIQIHSYHIQFFENLHDITIDIFDIYPTLVFNINIMQEHYGKFHYTKHGADFLMDCRCHAANIPSAFKTIVDEVYGTCNRCN